MRPAATLACPIVSALDRWLADSVQPAAQRWFGARVVEIRQISAYSCRGPPPPPRAPPSAPAFPHAPAIAAFTPPDAPQPSARPRCNGLPPHPRPLPALP